VRRSHPRRRRQVIWHAHSEFTAALRIRKGSGYTNSPGCSNLNRSSTSSEFNLSSSCRLKNGGAKEHRLLTTRLAAVALRKCRLPQRHRSLAPDDRDLTPLGRTSRQPPPCKRGATIASLLFRANPRHRDRPPPAHVAEGWPATLRECCRGSSPRVRRLGRPSAANKP